MWTTLIVKPIFNLLVLIYALLPGHNFGLSIIIFTVVVRLLMWPLVKKQLHQAKVMRDLQPELKRIKKAANKDRQKESLLMMELYKEKGINPFGSIGLLILQIPIFIGLYSGLKRIVDSPKAIITFSYTSLHSLPWMKTLAGNIHRFDSTLFGVVDLTRSALGKGGIYWPAMIIVLGSAIMQYYQAKQLMPSSDKKRSLRAIMKNAGDGEKADQSEINEAVGQSTRYFLPIFIFFLTVDIASALSLYWFATGVVAFAQQARVLGKDSTEMIAAVETGSDQVIEGEVLPPKKKKNNPPKKNAKKRRKR